MRHIEPGEIEQFERAKLEPLPPHLDVFAQDAVDVGIAGHTFTQRLERLGPEGASGMVDDEARSVLADHRGVARAASQVAQPGQHRRIGARAADHFDDAHQRHRIEEMVAAHPLRMAAGGGNGGDRQR